MSTSRMAGVLGGALNALDRFAIPAAAPVVLNVVWIGALVAAWQLYGDSLYEAGRTKEGRQAFRRAAETRAVVVVEHDMEFVRRLDCKVTVLHEGSVLAEGSLDHVTSNQDVIDVYLGR